MNGPTWLLVAATLVAAGTGTSAASPPAEMPATEVPVVFVCDHGSVKSLIAASLFNEAAARRGLRMRALARGVNPATSVPAAIAGAMKQDGFEVADFRPQALAEQDVAGAARVVAIGVDLSEHDDRARAPIASWNDVPPASVDYARARDDLARRIEELLDELQDPGTKPP